MDFLALSFCLLADFHSCAYTYRGNAFLHLRLPPFDPLNSGFIQTNPALDYCPGLGGAHLPWLG